MISIHHIYSYYYIHARLDANPPQTQIIIISKNFKMSITKVIHRKREKISGKSCNSNVIQRRKSNKVFRARLKRVRGWN